MSYNQGESSETIFTNGNQIQLKIIGGFIAVIGFGILWFSFPTFSIFGMLLFVAGGITLSIAHHIEEKNILSRLNRREKDAYRIGKKRGYREGSMHGNSHRRF